MKIFVCVISLLAAVFDEDRKCKFDGYQPWYPLGTQYIVKTCDSSVEESRNTQYDSILNCWANGWVERPVKWKEEDWIAKAYAGNFMKRQRFVTLIEALQCHSISEFDCTADDSRLRSACRELEAENTRSIETCPSSAKSCYYSTSFISEPGQFRLTLTIGGCEYGVINGCYSRSQLATIDPSIEDALEDLEDIIGSDIQGLQACFCTTNLCNDGLPNPDGSVFLQASYMIVGLSACIALLPVIDSIVM